MATTSLSAQEMVSRGLRSAVDAAAGAADAVTEGEGGFVENNFGWFIFIVAGVISVVLLVSVYMRELFWRKYGVDVCPGTGRRGRSQDVTNQIISDQEMAQELQRQLNEELREQERLEKRKERRTWYESYIKPYTMVSQLLENRGVLGTVSPPSILKSQSLSQPFLLLNIRCNRKFKRRIFFMGTNMVHRFVISSRANDPLLHC
jgi:hypothetical protein